MTPSLMPAAFLGHGSPMNALEQNRYTQAWQSFGRSVPRPRAILVISAHWYINATAVTAMAKPRTIHDFYGFPKPLFEVQYPAPGLPALAEEVADLARPTLVGEDVDSWGLDHGTWSVLVHAFPEADVPVVQLSINSLMPHDFHLELGAKLAPLRRRGVLILGSGNVVHNLRAIDWQSPDEAFDWNQRFNDRAKEVLHQRPSDAAKLPSDPDFTRAHPSDEHFIPLLYVAGVAAADHERVEALAEGYAYGSLSMTCFTVGADVPKADPTATDGAASVPDDTPWDGSNV